MIAKWKQYSREEIEVLYNKATSIKNFFQLMGYKGDPSALMRQEFSEKYPDLDLTTIRRNSTDLTGQNFGRLIVIERDKNALQKEKEQHQQFFLCKCSCGNIVSISRGNLLRGQKSCGCSMHEDSGNTRRIDMIGQHFGSLIVISLNKESTKAKGKTYYDCKCEKCGKIRTIQAYDLRSGNTQGCLCERLSHGERKINKLLSEMDIEFIMQFSFPNLINENTKAKLKMDFYLPQYNCCIEYQGIQHYEPVQQFGGISEFKHRQYLDDLKRQYCKEHNIKLVEIPYTDYGKLSKQYLKDKIDGI